MEPSATGWRAEPYDVAASLRVGEALDLSPTAAAILARRGLTDPNDAEQFLAAAVRHDPSTLPGAAVAAEGILGHIEQRSAIVVYGDYDVDGVCSTAILVRALRALGARPSWELPSRDGEGYGLSAGAVERLAKQGAELLVTVDCGITATAEVAAAKSAGLDVIVTDHHRSAETLPDCTIVHPALGDYGTPELCASGVALKLSEALYLGAGEDPRQAEQDLDLAALATVCDIVPLRGENRRIVRQGLERLAHTEKPGLRALMAAAQVAPAELDESALGFRLGPRINAAGRMQRADAALELLLTEDDERARQIADELDRLNHDRRDAEQRILFAAEATCAEQASQAAMVVGGEGWHPGVVGIVASRLVEHWHRPCVAVALEGDSGRGSGRSIPAYDLHAGLAACAQHLHRFGGHRVAAGLELDAAELPAFSRALARHAAAALSPADLRPVERVDAVVSASALGLPLAEELERLRPFGAGNPTPTLLVPGARIDTASAMGDERQHARFTLSAGGRRASGVAFGRAKGTLTAASERSHDLAVRLERRRWNGVEEARVMLRAMCPARPGKVEVLGEQDFWARAERELDADPAGRPAAVGHPALHDRRGAGLSGVAGELLTSGEPALVAVADVPRRRAGLEASVASLAAERLPVASWTALAAEPVLANGYTHLLALDPPPAGESDPLLGVAPHAHLAWGPLEVDFALALWRSELALRPALVEVWRALGKSGELAGHELRADLEGSGAYPRSPECCGRLLRVLSELGLVELDRAGWGCRAAPVAGRTELERSAAFRAYAERLAASERALAGRAAPARTAA